MEELLMQVAEHVMGPQARAGGTASTGVAGGAGGAGSAGGAGPSSDAGNKPPTRDSSEKAGAQQAAPSKATPAPPAEEQNGKERASSQQNGGNKSGTDEFVTQHVQPGPELVGTMGWAECRPTQLRFDSRAARAGAGDCA